VREEKGKGSVAFRLAIFAFDNENEMNELGFSHHSIVQNENDCPQLSATTKRPRPISPRTALHNSAKSVLPDNNANNDNDYNA